MYIEKLEEDDIKAFIHRRYKLHMDIDKLERHDDRIFVKLRLDDNVYEFSLKDFEVIAHNSLAQAEKLNFEEKWIAFMGSNFNYENNAFFGIKHTNKYSQDRQDFLRAKNGGRDC